jgi:hypothetical protein
MCFLKQVLVSCKAHKTKPPRVFGAVLYFFKSKHYHPGLERMIIITTSKFTLTTLRTNSFALVNILQRSRIFELAAKVLTKIFFQNDCLVVAVSESEAKGATGFGF